MSTETSELPDPLREALAAAYTAYVQTARVRGADRETRGAEFADLLAALRAQRWPAKYLAEVCGVSSERLRQISAQYATGAEPSLPCEIPVYTAARRRRREPVQRAHLSAEEAAEIRRLAPDAARHAGSLPQDSPYRRASDGLSALLRHHHQRGVIWAELSDATRPWQSWPIPLDTLEELRAQEHRGEVSAMPPLLRVSGVRQRVARSS